MNYYPIIDKSYINIQDREDEPILKVKYLPQRDIFLNNVSYFILNKCLCAKSTDEIISDILTSFDISDKEIITNDVFNTLKEFHNLGILKWKDNNNPFEKISIIRTNYSIKKCSYSSIKNIFDDMNFNISNVLNNIENALDENNLEYAILANKIVYYEAYKKNNLHLKICIELSLFNYMFNIRKLSFAEISDCENIIEDIINDIKNSYSYIPSKINEFVLTIKLDPIDENIELLKKLGFILSNYIYDECEVKKICFMYKKVKLK